VSFDFPLEYVYLFWYNNLVTNEPILTVSFFKTAANNEPVREWLKSLSQADCKTIGEDIKTVQYGWPMGMPMVEKIGKDLWEIRTKDLSVGIARTYFTIIGQRIILLHGFIKKSQKIPQTELDVARRRLSQLRGDQ
jgi:phage-related protein